VPRRSYIDKPPPIGRRAQRKPSGQGTAHADSTAADVPFMFPTMAAANASARGQRAAILASPLHELTGFYLAVDCRTPGCNGERTFAIAELASFYGRDSTVGQVLLRRMRCSRACGEPDCLAGDGSDPHQCSRAARPARTGTHTVRPRAMPMQWHLGTLLDFDLGLARIDDADDARPHAHAG
jgi:hypothetical protein